MTHARCTFQSHATTGVRLGCPDVPEIALGTYLQVSITTWLLPACGSCHIRSTTARYRTATQLNYSDTRLHAATSDLQCSLSLPGPRTNVVDSKSVYTLPQLVQLAGRNVLNIHIKVAEWLAVSEYRADPGSWQSACRRRES